MAIILQAIIPLGTVYLVIKLTDTHLGRIDIPFIYNYQASFYSVFLPNHSYLKPFYELFIDLSPQENQRWFEIGNYIGLSTNSGYRSLLCDFDLPTYPLQKMGLEHPSYPNKTLSCSFLLSRCCYLLMAFPFQYDMDFLFPTPLKQFLALGRFAWPFYFLISVFSLKALKTF